MVGHVPVLDNQDTHRAASSVMAFLQSTRTQRRQDSHSFVSTFMNAINAATLEPSAPGGAEQSPVRAGGHCSGELQRGRGHVLCAPDGWCETIRVPVGMKAGDKFPVTPAF